MWNDDVTFANRGRLYKSHINFLAHGSRRKSNLSGPKNTEGLKLPQFWMTQFFGVCGQRSQPLYLFTPIGELVAVNPVGGSLCELPSLRFE
jgi:hypothetical protein